MPARVLFVCTGNICRSPAAHAVLEAALRTGGLAAVAVDSCGLGSWHVGELADPRARAEGARRGLQLTHLARQLAPQDFEGDVLIIALDRTHLQALRSKAPPGFPMDRIVLYRSFDPASPPGTDVDDPYYDGDSAFVAMFDTLLAGVPGLLRTLRSRSG